MIKDFFYRYFADPLFSGSGYNIINTLAYSILFLIFLMFLRYILKALKLRVDREFILSVTPFVILGCFIRVIEDSGLIKSYFLKTPIIWILFFSFIVILLTISRLIQKRVGIPYYKIMFISGVILMGASMGMLKYTNLVAILHVTAWFLPFLIIIYLINWSTENKVVSSVQVFDSVVTFVSIRYFGYSEQHIVPNLIANLTGTWFTFIMVKLAVVVTVLLIVDKEAKDKDLRNLIKFAIAILGLGPGLRDLIRLLAFV